MSPSTPAASPWITPGTFDGRRFAIIIVTAVAAPVSKLAGCQEAGSDRACNQFISFGAPSSLGNWLLTMIRPTPDR